LVAQGGAKRNPGIARVRNRVFGDFFAVMGSWRVCKKSDKHGLGSLRSNGVHRETQRSHGGARRDELALIGDVVTLRDTEILQGGTQSGFTSAHFAAATKELQRSDILVAQGGAKRNPGIARDRNEVFGDFFDVIGSGRVCKKSDKHGLGSLRSNGCQRDTEESRRGAERFAEMRWRSWGCCYTERHGDFNTEGHREDSLALILKHRAKSSRGATSW